jgi:ribosomal protein S27AE
MAQKEEIKERLEAYAYQISRPVCSSCGDTVIKHKELGLRCSKCHSDDLMRLWDGVGQDWGIDWIVKDVIEDNFDKIDIEESLLDSLNEETVTIGVCSWGKGDILKEMDPVAFDCAVSDESSHYYDDEDSFYEFKESFYSVYEIEDFLDENLEE